VFFSQANFDPVVFIIFMVPETKGRSLEEIDEMFENHVSVRGFKKYHCISSETAREIVKMEGHESVHIEMSGTIPEL
jgi:hypothetical protein